jgi:hypothetical protein
MKADRAARELELPSLGTARETDFRNSINCGRITSVRDSLQVIIEASTPNWSNGRPDLGNRTA